ncbi:MAG TPA: hypothetical protein VEU96_32490 [Bryobacteraceae bacterium]|nr:hypothetical protein [Bryobacteraceae bacterium]
MQIGWRVMAVAAALLQCNFANAQGRQDPGRSIGTVSTRGDLIVVTLNEGVLGKANLFDLVHRTMKFTPEGRGYRAQNLALQWDSEFGDKISNPQVSLHNFAFPFSGKSWDSLSVGITGSLRFGEAQGAGRGGGVSIGRFDQLQEAARTLINTVPAICVFFKPRMSGARYVKELPDRVVITWELTEPAGNIQDFTWTPTVNRFQAVLRRDGSIEMSYDQVTAKDAIVGLYPMVTGNTEREIATLKSDEHRGVAGHLDLRGVKVSVVDGLFLKVTFETGGAVLADGDPQIAGIAYRVAFDSNSSAKRESRAHDLTWAIRGVGPFGRGGRASRYIASGPGAMAGVKVSGKTISMQGTLPAALKSGDRIAISVDVEAPGTPPVAVAQIHANAVTLTGIGSPEVDLSSLKRQDGPFTVLYESFHYLSLPNPRDLSCTVLKALGDKFDFLAYYSDFRVDNQEAGTPSNGPLGGNVTGIGQTQRGLESYCSAGRFQWGFVQPVYVGSNQMQERPPEGLTDLNTRNIASYQRQLGERSSDGKMLGYNYAMSQIGHEMGHRWAAFVSAKVGGEVIPLGPTHWARGLQAPVAFPYQRPSEASAMGGGVWQDNFDGTYTQLDDDYYVPATGWSFLDLYLMGMIGAAEVPDFFILRNLAPAGADANGHPIFRADRTKVTVQDVIAVEGPRLPDVYHSQRKFNTGIVVIVEHGATPSKELLERSNGIREQWIEYWSTTTGHRASMTASP